MPKRYESRLESELNLLSYILETGTEKRYWNKIQGYGVAEADFEKGKVTYRKTSRKIFRDRKKQLLDSKFIVLLRTKNKKSKYFGITPLGIIFLQQNRKIDSKFVIQRTFTILKFYFENFLKIHYKKSSLSHFKLVTTNLLYEIIDTFETDVLSNILRSVCSGALIRPKEDSTEISLSYKLENISIVFYEYVIENDINWILFDGHKTPKVTRDDDWMFRDISEFILSAIVYALFTKDFNIKQFSVSIDDEKLQNLQKKSNVDIVNEVKLFNQWLSDVLRAKISILESINMKIQ